MDQQAHIQRIKELSTHDLKKAMEEAEPLMAPPHELNDSFLLLKARLLDLYGENPAPKPPDKADILGIRPSVSSNEQAIIEKNRIRMALFQLLNSL